MPAPATAENWLLPSSATFVVDLINPNCLDTPDNSTRANEGYSAKGPAFGAGNGTRGPIRNRRLCHYRHKPRETWADRPPAQAGPGNRGRFTLRNGDNASAECPRASVRQRHQPTANRLGVRRFAHHPASLRMSQVSQNPAPPRGGLALFGDPRCMTDLRFNG